MEKVLMEISKQDYLLMTGVIEFHSKFSEYIRETDEELFFRAVDYAKTFTNVPGMEFGYWHEDNKKFLDELLRKLERRKASFNRLVEKTQDEAKARTIWKKKKNTTDDDFFGFSGYFKNFTRHAPKLEYDKFDMDDWVNFVKICKYIKNNDKFIEFALAKISHYYTIESELYKELKNEQES
jgi:hypothetical protein